MKRLLSALLSASILISSAASGVFAADVSAQGNEVRLYDISAVARSAASASKKSDTIESKMIKGFTNFDGSIEFVTHKKNASKEDWDSFAQEIVKVHDKLMQDRRFFYVSENIDFDGYRQGSTISITMKVRYIAKKDKLSEYKAKFDKAVKTYTSGVKSEWTDIQKIAYLHDKLVRETKYLKVDNSRYTSTPYSALVDKKALCTGYARAYCILLEEIGIESRLVVNDEHEWNLVKLGSSWYHVDCTYDDSFVNGTQQPYNVFHNYFLKSDSGLTDHAGYTPAGLAKSTKYDSMKWTNYNGMFGIYGKSLIYMGGDGAYSYDTASGKITRIFSVKDTWEVRWREYHDAYSWTDHWRSLDGTHSSLAPYGDAMYYNLAHGVYKYTPKTGKVTTVYTNKKSESMIISVFISDKKLYGVFMDKDGNEKTFRITDMK